MSRNIAVCPLCCQSYKKINDHFRTKHPERSQELTQQQQTMKKFRLETGMVTDGQLVALLGGKTENITVMDVVAVVQSLGVAVVPSEDAKLGKSKISGDLPKPPYIVPYDPSTSKAIERAGSEPARPRRRTADDRHAQISNNTASGDVSGDVVEDATTLAVVESQPHEKETPEADPSTSNAIQRAGSEPARPRRQTADDRHAQISNNTASGDVSGDVMEDATTLAAVESQPHEKETPEAEPLVGAAQRAQPAVQNSATQIQRQVEQQAGAQSVVSPICGTTEQTTVAANDPQHQEDRTTTTERRLGRALSTQRVQLFSKPAPRRKQLHRRVLSSSDDSDPDYEVRSLSASSDSDESPSRQRKETHRVAKEPLSRVLPVPKAKAPSSVASTDTTSTTSTDPTVDESSRKSGEEDDGGLTVVNPVKRFNKQNEGASKAQIQYQGLNQMFPRQDPKCQVLNQFYQYLVAQKESKENQANTQTNIISRYAFFSLTNQHTDLSRISNMETLDLAPMFNNKDFYEAWLLKLKNCGVGGEGRKNHEKALKGFCEWYKGKTDDESLLIKIDRFSEHLEFMAKTTSKQITKQTRKKTKALVMNPEQIKSLGQIQSFLKLPEVVDKKNSILQKLETTKYREDLEDYKNCQLGNGTIDNSVLYDIKTDFMFLVGQMLSIVGLKNCQRIGVIENLTLDEWKFAMDAAKSAQRLDDGTMVRVVYVFNHKTSNKQPAAFTLDEEDYSIFKIYYDYYRPLVALKPETNLDSARFLLNSRGENPENHGSQMLQRFQKCYLGSTLGESTVGDARHALETLNFSGRFINNQVDQDLVATYLAHSFNTGKKVYKLPTAANIAKASSLLRLLMTASDSQLGKVMTQQNEKLAEADAAEEFPKELDAVAFLAKHPIALDQVMPPKNSILCHCRLPAESSEYDKEKIYSKIKGKWYYRQKKLFYKEATKLALEDGNTDETIEERATAACQKIKFYRVKSVAAKSQFVKTVANMIKAKINGTSETVDLDTCSDQASLTVATSNPTDDSQEIPRQPQANRQQSTVSTSQPDATTGSSQPRLQSPSATVPCTSRDISHNHPTSSSPMDVSGNNALSVYYESSFTEEELSQPPAKKKRVAASPKKPTSTPPATSTPTKEGPNSKIPARVQLSPIPGLSRSSSLNDASGIPSDCAQLLRDNEMPCSADAAGSSNETASNLWAAASTVDLQPAQTPTPERVTKERATQRKLQFSGLQLSERKIVSHVNKQSWPKLETKDAGFAGRGVFVSESSDGFVKDEYVCDYKGWVVSTTMFNSMTQPSCPKAEEICNYAQAVTGKNTVILAHTDNGSYGRLINHSPHNTCINVLPKCRRLPDGLDHVLFYAKRALKPGEQLFRDYGKDYANIANLSCLNPACPKKTSAVSMLS